MAEKSFNLLDEQWIRVIDGSGRSAEVSLLELFAHAHEYKRLANETETVDIAILRLLLAILYAVFSSVDAEGKNFSPTSDNALAHWKSLWDKERFSCELIAKYLDYFRERFYLFHPETPFYQVASLSSRKCTEYKTPKLIGDLSQSENKVRLFSGRIDSARLSYAEAARWLLHLNAFDDTSAKPSARGEGMESPGAGWLGKLGLIFSEGQNLFRTLLLNFVLSDHDGSVFDRGKPIWETPVRAEERVKIAQPKSLAELYTLQSRRLLLLRDGDAVTGYKLLGGDFFEKAGAFIEQMTLWRRDEKTGVFTPKRHNPARQLWRDFEALIVRKDGSRVPGVVQWNERLSYEELIEDARLKFSAPSIKYGDKDFFADDMFSDAVSLNARLLGRLSDIWQTQIVEILKVTDDAVLLFGRFALDLALAGGADDEKNNKASIRADAREQAYGELDIPFRNWLAAIKGDEDINAVLIAWKHSVRNILLKLANGRLDAAGDAAFIGRKGNTAFTAELNFKARLKETLNLPGTERRDNE